MTTINSVKIKRIILILASIVFLCLLAFFCKFFPEKRSPIRITEVCAKNISAAYDDNANYGADYVELYNNSDAPVNLSGWALSDNKRDLEKFIFQDYTLEPQQTVMVWSSPNIDDTSMYKEDFRPSDIHDVPFRFSNGEQVILSSPDKKIITRVGIPGNLPDNKAYSSSLSNLGKFFICDATPYYVPESKIREVPQIESPTFSVEGGWFDNEISVSLSAPKGDIYYTLDGSVPTENSLKYEGPITVTNRTSEPNIYSNIDNIAYENTYLPDYNVDKATVLKAVAISSRGKSQVASETYYVGLDSYGYKNTAIMSISMDPEDLFNYEKGIYCIGKAMDLKTAKYDADPQSFIYDSPNYAKEGRGWERPAEIEFLSPEHKKEFEQKIGLRIHGGWSVAENQKSFNMYARPEYDNNEAFKYDFFKDGTGLQSKLMLRSGGSTDLFVTKMRDVFCQSLVEDRNIGTQKGIPCEVFINGEYWGLYVIQETISEDYVSTHYNVSPDNVLIIKNTEDVFNTNTDNPEDTSYFTEILDFAASNDLTVPENYKWISDRIDIQSMIDYYITEIYVANSDSFSNNLALWRTITPDGSTYGDCKWRWLLYDLDESTNLITNRTNPSMDSFIDGQWRDSNPLLNDTLLCALIENEEFKGRFASTFMDMMNYNFNPDNVLPKLNARAKEFKEGDVKSHKRFRGPLVVDSYDPNDDFTPPYTEEDFAVDIKVIADFFTERPKYMQEYLLNELELKDKVGSLSVSCNCSSDYEIKINTLSFNNLSTTWKGNYLTEHPVHLSFSSDNASFTGWEVNGKLVSTSPEYDVTVTTSGTKIRAVTK